MQYGVFSDWLLLLSTQYAFKGASQGALVVKNLSVNAKYIRDAVPSLGQEHSLEEGMTTYSSVLAWRIPWTQEPGGLQSMESHRVRHN